MKGRLQPQFPLRQHLDLEVDEEQVPRMWRRIQRGVRRPSWSRRGAVAAIAVAAAILLAVWSAGVWQTPADAGALAATSGTLPIEWSVPHGAQRRVDLEDGSRIDLESGTRLEVLTNTGSAFVMSLKRGRGAFEVKPGGPRQWVVECGFVTVEVVGTQFSVDRSADAVHVSVHRGKVKLRGEGVDQLLTAGESATLRDPRRPAAAADSEPPRNVPPTDSDHAENTTSEATNAAAGDQIDPIRSPTSSLDQWDRLLRQADAARRSGDRGRALELLDQVVRDCPDKPRRNLAAFTLARLQLDDDPKTAARTLNRALDSGMTRGLSEHALARLVEAQARAGDHQAARRTAAEYRSRYPEGQHLAEVQHWASEE